MFSSPVTRSRTPAVASPRSEPTLAATLAPIERLRLSTASAAAAPTLPAKTPIAAALRTRSTGLVERGSTRRATGHPRSFEISARPSSGFSAQGRPTDSRKARSSLPLEYPKDSSRSIAYSSANSTTASDLPSPHRIGLASAPV
jgi:hypothetical protein